jgi:hypothetical protein
MVDVKGVVFVIVPNGFEAIGNPEFEPATGACSYRRVLRKIPIPPRAAVSV